MIPPKADKVNNQTALGGFFNGQKETFSRLDACQSERISFRQRILPTNRQSEWDIRAESSWLGKEIRETGRGLFHRKSWERKLQQGIQGKLRPCRATWRGQR